ncbi:Mitochondrial inner membrane magnesium transporter LPE10 [Psilocybe cubensis]|uniref:Mitochondrial inner membrane magnesium transporter LPE10 n=2 Tax=Psilocybe cubensis TaxID=181762 RepID=A0ACB8GQ16_PSICU|nr:Mitochondrial inner membrane magnesium transporter LPE10 [Psilocybe cubensis]KAH9477462.1 Mitochondrial inner membrane magnesium transporter LPE10 [Psilocybe cubensis]
MHRACWRQRPSHVSPRWPTQPPTSIACLNQLRNFTVDHRERIRIHASGLYNRSLPPTTRQFSWSFKSQPRLQVQEFTELPDNEQDVTRAAILDKVMKGRQPTDLMLRCTILDAEGNVKTISGQFKKSDLSAEHRLNARDLRKIDSRIPNLVPTILVRKEAILVNILHIRALVKADAVILFDTFGSADSRLHSVFLYHLEHNLKSKGAGTPYEFRALESILLSVLSALEAEMVFIRNLVGGLLAEMEDNIDHDRFKRLLHYSRRLASFKNRATLVEEALDEVLSQDEDMDAMYLTDKKNNQEVVDHEELEVLLESFSKQVEEIVNEAENIESNVQSTQEIVELILDSNRNALLALDLQVSIATLGVGSGALVAGLFGMNLLSHFENHPYGFYVMTGLSATLAFLVAFTGFRKLSKIRKVGLSSTTQKLKPTKQWLPLPLRNRIPGGWS